MGDIQGGDASLGRTADRPDTDRQLEVMVNETKKARKSKRPFLKQIISHCLKERQSSSDIKNTTHVIIEDVSGFPITAVIVDGMAFIRTLSIAGINTCGDFADWLLCKLKELATSYHTSRVVFVADRYLNPNSIQLRRWEDPTRRYQENGLFAHTELRTGKGWKANLDSSSYKYELLKFLLGRWPSTILRADLHLTLAVDQRCLCLKWTSELEERPHMWEQQELASNHDEADTLLILHAKHVISTDQSGRVVLISGDTDVAVIGILHAAEIGGEILMAYRKGTDTEIVSLTSMAHILGARLSKALPSLYLLAVGCDTTPLKFSPWPGLTDALPMTEGYVHSLLELFGESGTCDNIELLQKIEDFLRSLYNRKMKQQSNNVSNPVPDDAASHLIDHVKRSCYQGFHWRNATTPMIADDRLPEEHGWIRNQNGSLSRACGE